jgi:hypothetical protein
MTVQADPSLVTVGASFTCAAREEYYAATQAVMPEKFDGPTTNDMTPELTNIDKMIKKGEFADAERFLRIHLIHHPGHYSAHRMLAEIHLEGPPPLNNPKLAADQIKQAYAKGGDKDPAVIKVLAETLGRNGDGEQGLRFLERLNVPGLEPEARSALANHIYKYRSRFNLGHEWQFADQYGEIIFDTEDVAEAVKALVKGAVPKESKCRRDRVGDWQPIEHLLAPEFPEVAKLYGMGPTGGASKKNDKTIFYITVLLGFLIILAMFLPGLIRALSTP